MSDIKFYSEYDWACGGMLSKIIKKVRDNVDEREWNIIDVIEAYNILKYLSIHRFKGYVVQETKCDMTIYEKQVKKNIGTFLAVNKEVFLESYKQLDYDYKEDFFSIIEEHKLYLDYSNEDINLFMDRGNPPMHIVLKYKKFVETFDLTIKEKLVSNVKNVEIILSKFLKEQVLYLPNSLKNEDIEALLAEYINSDEANINVLRRIINFPSDRGVIINDKIKLCVKRKIKEKGEEILSKGTTIESSVEISYSEEQDEPITFVRNGGEVEVSEVEN